MEIAFISTQNRCLSILAKVADGHESLFDSSIMESIDKDTRAATQPGANSLVEEGYNYGYF